MDDLAADCAEGIAPLSPAALGVSPLLEDADVLCAVPDVSVVFDSVLDDLPAGPLPFPVVLSAALSVT